MSIQTSCTIYKYRYAINKFIEVKKTESGVIKTFLQNDGTKSIKELKNANIFFPLDFNLVPSKKVADIFSLMFPRVTELSDGEFNVYFSFRILGGMDFERVRPEDDLRPGPVPAQRLIQEVPHINNDELAAVIRVNIRRTLRNDEPVTVRVRSRKHKFPGSTELRDARRITITPMGGFDEFITVIKRAIVGVTFRDREAYNATAIRDYVLGNDQTAEEREKALADLRRAFAERRGFTVIISQDGEWLDIEMEDDRCVIM